MLNPPIRVGILGCGMVAAEYATTLASSDLVTLAACADAEPGRAAAFAATHAIPRVMDVTRLLDPDAVDVVVVLTPPATHAALTRAAIAAGIPAVWVEKPLAASPEEAFDLLHAAHVAGVRLGAAPDTPLAPPTRTAVAALQAGLIGEPVAASASLLCPGPERWHPDPEQFHAAGAGPLGDMAPYYLATLHHLLGPITRVAGAAAMTRTRRTIRAGERAGQTFTASAPTHVTAVLETESGLPVTFIASFDAVATRAPHLEIHGSDGTLVLPDPNFHTGPVMMRTRDQPTWGALTPAERPAIAVGRGMGVLDLARCLLTGDPPAETATVAAHTVAVTHAILTAAATGAAARVPTPAPRGRAG